MFSVRSQAAPIREPLTPRELLTLLLDRGLLDREALVAGAVRVQSASRRNHNFFVENDHGPSFFVKQGISDGTATTVGREAAFYQHAPNASPGLTRHLPRFIAFVPDECVLVLDMVSEAVPSRPAVAGGSRRASSGGSARRSRCSTTRPNSKVSRTTSGRRC